MIVTGACWHKVDVDGSDGRVDSDDDDESSLLPSPPPPGAGAVAVGSGLVAAGLGGSAPDLEADRENMVVG